MTEKKAYETPEIAELGSIVESTGHCSSGCDHDSVLHPDEFKSSGGVERGGGDDSGSDDLVAIGC